MNVIGFVCVAISLMLYSILTRLIISKLDFYYLKNIIQKQAVNENGVFV